MTECCICSYKTERQSNLDRHLKSKKHANKVRELEEAEQEEREQRKHFICIKCGKRFPKQRDLTRHENRVKPCVEPGSQSIEQHTTINNNTLNQTFNIMYAPVMNERLYKDTKYDHITEEFLTKVRREYDRGDLYPNNREAEVYWRYNALTMVFTEVHWNLSIPENRNLLTLCIMPWTDRKTSCEYYILDSKNDIPSWKSISVNEFNYLTVSMLRTIQEENHFDLTPMIDFVGETLETQYIGIINKVFANAYYAYMGSRECADKRYSRPKMIPQKTDNAIRKQYIKFRNHEAVINNGIPINIDSTLRLTN